MILYFGINLGKIVVVFKESLAGLQPRSSIERDPTFRQLGVLLKLIVIGDPLLAELACSCKEVML